MIVNIANVVCKLEWDGSYSYGRFPHDAVSVGWTQGDALYICRAYKENNLLPGKFHPRHNTCFLPWNGGEVEVVDKYDIAIGTEKWAHYNGKNIPSGAFVAGNDRGETVYVCRGVVKNFMQPGKFKPSHRICYIPFATKEYKLARFDVLVN